MTENNYYEWSERYLNSRRSDEIITGSNLTTDISLSKGADLDRGSLTDSSQGHLDLTGDGNDLCLATGQSIEG